MNRAAVPRRRGEHPESRIASQRRQRTQPGTAHVLLSTDAPLRLLKTVALAPQVVRLPCQGTKRRIPAIKEGQEKRKRQEPSPCVEMSSSSRKLASSGPKSRGEEPMPGQLAPSEPSIFSPIFRPQGGSALKFEPRERGGMCIT